MVASHRTPSAEDNEGRSAERPLVLFALAYVVVHHAGEPLARLGRLGAARWADWIDLALPYLVVIPALLTVERLQPTGSMRLAAVVAALIYVSGHGIHLAANAIDAREPGPAATLWDETVGHAVWYVGIWALVAVLTWASADRPLRASWWGYVLAATVGVTHATNAEGANGLVIPAALVAAGFVAWSLIRRDRPTSRVLLVAYVAALLALGVTAVAF